MEIKTPIQDGTGNTPRQLPLGGLFYLLYSNGFSVKPDDYIEMLKITERFGSHDIDATAQWLCPIIATNETEQAKFYNIIEQYKKLSIAQDQEEPATIKPLIRWLLIAAAIAVAALLFLFVYYSLPEKTYTLLNGSKESFIEKGDSLLLDATALLQSPQDTGKVKCSWLFDDGSRSAGAKTTHVFTKPGNYLVKRQFASQNFALSKQSDSITVHVCNDLPKLQLNVPAEPAATNEPITISAVVDADTGTVSYYQWTINDTVFTTQAPVAKDLVFTKEGDYVVQCRAVVGSVNSPCTVTANKTIKVLDNGIQYSAVFSSNRPGNYTTKTGLKWWTTLLLLLPAAAALFYALFRRRPTKTVTQTKASPGALANKGPYEIPFEQNDIKLIQQDRELRRTFIQMRYRSEEETLVLSVAGTITSIIKSGGSPQLVYAPLTQQQQYLVLIDRANPKSMLTHLFTWLVKSIADDGIPVSTFYYDKNFVCYNDGFPGGLTLQRLAETNNNATLIILGKAHELVYNVYPSIEEKFLKELSRWQSKAVITPVPLKDWSAKEKILQQYLVLLPADSSSLQQLMPALREKIKPNTGLLETTDAQQYTLRETDFRDGNELRNYLGQDEVLFQWLCAICIYPKLKWEIVVEVGKTILDKYNQPEKLNYTNLLKLCRITWMQQGVFPQATRLELLKELTVDNEVCAREKLLRMLNYSTSLYGENGHFYEEEKKRQQLTNQFILHASNNSRYAGYADSREAFKKIWQNDAILDMPLKKYLDKTSNGQWQTPVNIAEHSVGLTTYFEQHSVSGKKDFIIKKIAAAAVTVLLLGVWVWLGYGGGAQKIHPYIVLDNENTAQMVPVIFTVLRDFSACGDTVQKNFDQLGGYFDNEKLQLTWDAKTATASFAVPYKSIVTGKADILFTWAGDKTAKASIVFTGHRLPDTVTISCVNNITNKRIPLYVRYNDTAGYRSIEASLADVLNRFNLSPEQADFTDTSHIIYYEKNQKARADSIAELVKQGMGINVREDFISEERTPPAVPMLFLNTMDSSSNKGPVVTEPETGDYYHSMADQYYQDKQYMQAIQAYGRALTINPKDALAYYQRGICYEELGPSYADKAIVEYSAAIRLNAKDAASWYRRASVRYSLKRYADAITDYSKLISLNAPDMKKQINNSVYFRGKSYYFLKNLASACNDFKKAAALGIAAGKQDYAAYCNINTTAPGPDCSRTFYSLKEAVTVNATVVCKLDLSKENMVSIPKEVYGFKNLTQLNLGANAIPQDAVDQLQKALPGCKISNVPANQQTITEFGYIELDNGGYTDAAGQQVMEKVSRLLKAQPSGKIRLTASYTDDAEEKIIAGYMNTIINMFAKIGVNPKIQIEQKLNKNAPQIQQQQKASVTGKGMRIQVTGINLIDRGPAAK